MLTLDIIVLLIVVVLIFQRLFKVLGSNSEGSVKKVKLSKEGAEKLYNLLRSEAELDFKEAAKHAEELIPVDSQNLTPTELTLRNIPDFNKQSFLNGAKKAFQVIIEAFNKADLETLKILVSPAILKKMQKVIKQRQEDQISSETDFICFDKVEIAKAEIKEGKDALISVEFVTEQVNVLRDKDNQVIEGDENYIQTITDVWTFERALNSKNLNWMLVSTKK